MNSDARWLARVFALVNLPAGICATLGGWFLLRMVLWLTPSNAGITLKVFVVALLPLSGIFILSAGALMLRDSRGLWVFGFACQLLSIVLQLPYIAICIAALLVHDSLVWLGVSPFIMYSAVACVVFWQERSDETEVQEPESLKLHLAPPEKVPKIE